VVSPERNQINVGERWGGRGMEEWGKFWEAAKHRGARQWPAASEIEELAEERNGKTKHKCNCCGRETEQRRSAVWHMSHMSGEAVLSLIGLSRTMEWAGPRTRAKLLLAPRKSIQK
jgi:hypothetical protein